MKFDLDVGTFVWEVRRLEKFYVNLDSTQDSEEKLCICEGIACAELHTSQVMVVSGDDSIDCIDSLEEHNFANFCFKISLQALSCLWKLPKWVILDNGIATPEEYLIWNWINTAKWTVTLPSPG
jgi:hypothetical protein